MVWSEIVQVLLANAPNTSAVGASLLERIRVNSWAGSRVRAMEARLPLFDAISHMVKGEALAIVATERRAFEESLAEERAREARGSMEREDAFE